MSVSALQRREQRSAVWSSVLGCLLHLCTYNGRLVRAFLEGLSLRAVRALLHCSLRDHWAPDVHRQLISLAVALMYVPQEEQPGERRLPFAVSPRGEHFCRYRDPHWHKWKWRRLQAALASSVHIWLHWPAPRHSTA